MTNKSIYLDEKIIDEIIDIVMKFIPEFKLCIFGSRVNDKSK
jgi:hypothetical protein